MTNPTQRNALSILGLTICGLIAMNVQHPTQQTITAPMPVEAQAQISSTVPASITSSQPTVAFSVEPSVAPLAMTTPLDTAPQSENPRAATGNAAVLKRFSVRAEGDPWQAYRTLREVNAAPFAAYLSPLLVIFSG